MSVAIVATPYAPNASASFAASPARAGSLRPAYILAVTRGLAWRASRGSLWQGESGRERHGNERVAQVVNADALAPLAVQAGGVAGRVDGAEHVAAAVRPSAQRREDERVGLDAGERLARDARACARNSAASFGSSGTVAVRRTRESADATPAVGSTGGVRRS